MSPIHEPSLSGLDIGCCREISPIERSLDQLASYFDDSPRSNDRDCEKQNAHQCIQQPDVACASRTIHPTTLPKYSRPNNTINANNETITMSRNAHNYVVTSRDDQRRGSRILVIRGLNASLNESEIDVGFTLDNAMVIASVTCISEACVDPLLWAMPLRLELRGRTKERRSKHAELPH
jgi:hypothetical protein